MATLKQCRSELRSIINELNSIASGIEQDFVGIGEDKCSRCVSKISGTYSGVLRRLERVNTNRLADWVNKDKE